MINFIRTENMYFLCFVKKSDLLTNEAYELFVKDFCFCTV